MSLFRIKNRISSTHLYKFRHSVYFVNTNYISSLLKYSLTTNFLKQQSITTNYKLPMCDNNTS